MNFDLVPTLALFVYLFELFFFLDMWSEQKPPTGITPNWQNKKEENIFL
jgi:hypothetical protein